MRITIILSTSGVLTSSAHNDFLHRRRLMGCAVVSYLRRNKTAMNLTFIGCRQFPTFFSFILNPPRLVHATPIAEGA